VQKRWPILLALALTLSFSVQGCIYSKVQRPLDENFDQTRLGSKTGRSHFQSVLWLVAWGDGGTKAAAENGGITTIRHADTEYTLILFGLYTRATTIVYGD